METVRFTGGAGDDTIQTADHGGRIDGGAGIDTWAADLGGLSSNVIFTLGTTTAIAAADLDSILRLEAINLTTGSGNDQLVGGTLADGISSGAGNDTINAGTRLGGGVDVVDGGAGSDTLVVDASAETQRMQLFSGGSPTFAVRSNSGRFYVDAYNMEKVKFKAGSANDSIDTADHGGTVDGGAGLDFWSANLGALATNVSFTLGTTSAIGAAGLSSILNIERIALTTGGGNDTLVGGVYADQLAGGAGDDKLDGLTRLAGGGGVGTAGDVLDGGLGVDTLIVDASAETQRVQLFSGGAPTFGVRSNSGKFYVDAYNMEKVRFKGGAGDDLIDTANHGGTVDGGAGTDKWTADLSAVTTGITFTLGTTTSIAAAELTSLLRIERVDLTTGSGDDTLVGGGLADRLAGGAGNDTIDARGRRPSSGIDLVDGGAGNDTLIVDAGSETMGLQLSAGGAPTFALRSNSGNFAIDAYNMETVSFTAGAGDDILTGGSGNDTLLAGAGKDTLRGGAGNDSLTGGAEADLFVVSSGGGTDTVADFSGSAGQGDRLGLEGGLVGTFAYRGGGAFTGTGNTEARFAGGLVQVDFDGNGVRDVAISIGGAGLSAADFVLL